MQEINFVITDLDDTIWDWLEMWYKSFQPYLERISRETNIDINILKADFKALHRKYGTTEMSFIYKELPSIKERFYDLFEKDIGDVRSIIHEYNSNKKNNLYLYDGVIDTLKYIKSKKSVIVAFTESNVFFTKYRIKHLGLDKIIDCVYSPKGQSIPSSVTLFYAYNHWDPKETIIRPLPQEARKPDAEILKKILADFNANINKTIYIGDKLDRDIYMAQQAGITNVYAEYGHIIDDGRYLLLKEVTHWSDEEVKREMKFKSEIIKISPPDYRICKFNQLQDLFTFAEYKDG